MNTVVTLIGAGHLEEDLAGRVAAALGGTPDWLAPGTACDIETDRAVEDAAPSARGLVGDRPVDVVTQPAAGRRKRLLVADMESTIIENEMLDELAEELGLRDEIAGITARAMRGELDFEAAVKARVAMLAGLEEAALARAEARIRVMPGAAALVATMRADGAYCALVSGGFTYYTGLIRKRLGFDEDQANMLGLEAGKLTGEVLPPILGRDAKLAALHRLAKSRDIRISETLAVGDGANDLDMLGAAGLGVAYRAKPKVAAVADAQIDYGDLKALLYLQGYRDAEIRDTL